MPAVKISLLPVTRSTAPQLSGYSELKLGIYVGRNASSGQPRPIASPRLELRDKSGRLDARDRTELVVRPGVP